MATACGMGDVLTGVIAALVAQGLSPLDAARFCVRCACTRRVNKPAHVVSVDPCTRFVSKDFGVLELSALETLVNQRLFCQMPLRQKRLVNNLRQWLNRPP